ncbi:MAG: TetR-like C-terminal domain-containing protein [Actinomycetota bacterium]
MPKQRVNLEEVTMTAMAIVDRQSLDALTLSAVAAELGLRPSALYTYFDNVDALRYAVAVRATTNLTDDLRNAAVGQAGNDAIVALAYCYRNFALRHPGQYAATLSPPQRPGDDLTHASWGVTDVFARVIANFGHEGDKAIHAARAARSAIHGFVALEAGRSLSTRTDRDASFDHLIGTVISGLG